MNNFQEEIFFKRYISNILPYACLKVLDSLPILSFMPFLPYYAFN